MKILLLITSFFVLTFSSFANVNAESSYTYYWGQGCSYCAKADSYFKGVEDISLVNLEKREVYYDKENAKKMTEDADRLGIDTPGVPFLIINNNGEESYLNGDVTIIDHFIPILGEPIPNNKKTIILIILGLLVIIIPILIIKGGSQK